MSSRALATWARSITVKLLAIHFFFLAASALIFYLSAFLTFNHVLLDKESEVIREILRQMASVSATSSTFEDVTDAASDEITEFGSNNILIRLYSKDKDIFLPSEQDWDGYKEALPDKPNPAGGIITIAGEEDSLLRLGTVRTAKGYYVQVGYRSDSRSELFDMLLRISVIAFVPTLLLGLICGAYLSRKALSGIAGVRHAAMEIYQGNLDRRVERNFNQDEIDRLAEAFNLMLSRIQTLIKNMRGMLDNVAHDLRTPLTRMRGAAEVALGQSRTTEEYRDVLERSMTEYDVLISMVNVILNLSQAESGAMRLDKAWIDVCDLLDSVHDFFQPLAQENGVDFNAKCEGGLRLYADEQRLRQVILNLLDNAFKYTARGGDISLSAKQEGDVVVLSVRDAGAGIAPEDLGHVFERFYRSDKSRKHAGYGLGLSLVKAIVELHGGRVIVESELGKGTEFKVALPA